MSSSRDSSPGVMSQVSYEDGNQNENGHETTISQAQLATQIVPTDTQRDYTHDGPPAQPFRSQFQASWQVVNSEDAQSTTKSLQALFQGGDDTSTNEKFENGSSELPDDSLLAQRHKTEDDSIANSIQAEDDALTQQELLIPIASEQVLPETEDQDVEAIDTIDNKSLLPRTIEEYGLELGINGRLSSRMCYVPQDQATLLESNDKWYPSLVGSSGRKPTVPLALLNHLTARADEPDLDVVHSRLSNTKNVTVFSSRDVDVNASSPSHTSSSSSVAADMDENSDWPPSPPRPARSGLLPPDSPLQPIDHKNQKGTQLHEQGDNHTSQKEDHQTYEEQSSAEPRSVDVSQRTQGPSTASRSQNMNDHDSTEQLVNSSSSNQTKFQQRRTNTVVHTSQHEDDINSFKKSVQVDRTPHPVKQDNSPQTPQTSTLIVPASFDERQTFSKQATVGAQRSDIKKHYNAARQDFEHDSSEDESSSSFRAGLLGNKTKSAMNRKSEKSSMVDGKESSVDRHSPQSSTSKTHKRDRSQEEANDRDLTKRQRLSQASGSYPTRASPSYHELDIERRTSRREVLGKLAHNNDSKSTHKSTVKSKHTDTLSMSSFDSTQQSVLRQEYSDGARRYLPSLQIRPSPDKSSKLKKASTMSVQELQVLSNKPEESYDLYRTFKLAYAAYKGERKDFDASCRLLRATRAQNSLHPSLWDAFVFRHYHDYRPYLHVVIEESGTAVPYTEFFDNIIEPGHTQRVITPSTLDETHGGIRSTTLYTPGASSLHRGSSIGSANPVSIHHAPTHLQAATAQQASTVVEQVQTPEEELRSASQGSPQSVQAWLERARGAKSPILGTPEVVKSDRRPAEDVSDLEVPEPQMDQRATKPIPTGTESSRATSKHVHKHEPMRRPPTDATKAKNRIQSSDQPRHSTSIRETRKKEDVVDTVFKQFARDYNRLPSERGSHARPSTQTFVDVFRWRK